MYEVVISEMKESYRLTGRPASSTALAVRCNVHRQTMWRWLREMEQAQLVKRFGQRRGWLPANMN